MIHLWENKFDLEISLYFVKNVLNLFKVLIKLFFIYTPLILFWIIFASVDFDGKLFIDSIQQTSKEELKKIFFIFYFLLCTIYFLFFGFYNKKYSYSNIHE